MVNINFKDEALKIKDEIINIRRYFHQNPELGFEEFKTSEKIKQILKNEGINYFSISKTGVCGIIKGQLDSDDNNVIALRADMDGLPIEEKNNCSYKSKSVGKMHGCGHDAHMAILLGAAKIINNNKDKFSGVVKLIFEPAEETIGGATFMINEGILEKPKVNAIIGLHVEESLNVGEIMIKSGVVNAASNPFSIKVMGKGGHGAYPHMAIDPIVISSQIILALQTIVSRRVNTLNPTVLTVGSINGGSAQNVIPDEVVLKGIIRTTNKKDRIFIKEKLIEITEGICLANEASCNIEIEESYPSLYNDDDMVELVKKSAIDILGFENVKTQKNIKLGVESFAYFANERKSAFYFLGVKNKLENIIYPAHNSKFNIDEDAIILGIALQCKIVFDYFD